MTVDLTIEQLSNPIDTTYRTTFYNRDRDFDLENALKMSMSDDGAISYEDLRQNLKKLDFADMEIEMFFSRYDVDVDGVIDDNDYLAETRPMSGREARSARNRPMTAAAGVGGAEFGV
jgi:hypothetical protein